MLAALNILFLALLCVWIWKQDAQPLHRLFWPALATKCIAGIALGVIYSTYYGSSDTFIFFKLASDQADLARENFGEYLNFLFRREEGFYLGEHRTVFFSKVTSVLALLTGNNYWLASLYYSLLSFFGAWHLSNTIARLFPNIKLAAALAFLFFPSAVFWSSGIIKESLAMAALFFLSAQILKIWMKERITVISVVLVIINTIVIFNLKYYYLAVFIPISLSALLVKLLSEKMQLKSSFVVLILWVVVLCCGFAAVTLLHPNFAPEKILNVIMFNNKVFMNACTPDDVAHYYRLEPTWMSMFINAPWALVSGLFRPFVWEANTIFKFITSLENLALLMLAVLSLRHIKSVARSSEFLLTFSVIAYCVVLSVFLALSTPNFGTLARYGVGYLPFFALLVFSQPWVTKWLARVRL
jgi:hypothetical protein